tara:strand:- start:215 stop:550 length:336 start_codon:yes stop_codon:yes gene_type:complete
MAYAKIENKIVVFKTYEINKTLTEIPDNVCCGMIQNKDGTFSNPPKKFDEEISKLRFERNRLLAQTDWWCASDQTPSESRLNYRQNLRDITKGIKTVNDIESIIWPEEPTS